MKVYQLDPLRDVRWAAFVEVQPMASVFHTIPWLQSLQLTYGYEPVVFTTSTPSEALKNGLVFCRINSWLTGRRLVSLPFSDHCDSLSGYEDGKFLIRYLQTELKRQKWKYLEVRPLNTDFSEMYNEVGFSPEANYFMHVLDLGPELECIFHNLNKDSVQRRVQRAQRLNLVERTGKSEELLDSFYMLFVLTRARHRLPPIPKRWFQNLVQCLGDAVEIRIAYKDTIPISAILTLRFNDVVIYKYGCSNSAFKQYGATPWLLWRAIAAAKSSGAGKFDFGRTDKHDAGLLAFKNKWVPQPKQFVYWKFPPKPFLTAVGGWKLKVAKYIFSCMPKTLLRITGELIYRHIG